MSEFDIEYRLRTTIKGQALADFIVESLDACSREDGIEKWVLETYGSSRTQGRGGGIVRRTCGHYPIHGPARLAFKWKEKCEKKMWVDFRVLENPSQRRNGFTLESPLTFIFIFKWGKPSKNKKPQ